MILNEGGVVFSSPLEIHVNVWGHSWLSLQPSTETPVKWRPLLLLSILRRIGQPHHKMTSAQMPLLGPWEEAWASRPDYQAPCSQIKMSQRPFHSLLQNRNKTQKSNGFDPRVHQGRQHWDLNPASPNNTLAMTGPHPLSLTSTPHTHHQAKQVHSQE